MDHQRIVDVDKESQLLISCHIVDLMMIKLGCQETENHITTATYNNESGQSHCGGGYAGPDIQTERGYIYIYPKVCLSRIEASFSRLSAACDVAL